MKRRLLPIVLAAVALGVHAAVQDGDTAPGEAAPPASLPAVALTPQMMYQFLLAEIAGARGQVGLSSEAYIDLARRTRTPGSRAAPPRLRCSRAITILPWRPRACGRRSSRAPTSQGR